ncbi:hypothetical protein GHT06_021806 [Daphnia sinensis]|uniref:Apple domain-containing protein n=1 Tax=Daphnia sinensis TaxID=1820382 RepID=A0AAD5PN14_9CRUS|nr:hypothetical protein GHT06_021806 [Daphnia sinensis]
MLMCIRLFFVVWSIINLSYGEDIGDNEDGVRNLTAINPTLALLNVSAAESNVTSDDVLPGFNVVINNGGFSQIGGTSIASGVSSGPGDGNRGGGTVVIGGIPPNFGEEFNDGGGDVKWLMNCDFPGHDIGRLESSGEECGGICISNLQCTHFSHSDGYCYMKRAPLTISRTTQNGGMCGFIPWRFDPKRGNKNWNDGGDGAKWLRNCDFPGHDIRRQVASPEECGGICVANSQCTHFRRPDNDEYCYLKNAPSGTSRTPINGGVCGIIPWRL